CSSNTITGLYAFSLCKNLKGIKLKGRNSTFIFYNSEQTFYFLSLKPYQKMSFIKDNSDSYIFNLTSCAFVAVYLFIEYRNKMAEEYLKENICDSVTYLTNVNDVQNLMRILHFIKKDDIDYLIEYAIQQRKTEIQVILSNYKNKTFGFSDNFDKFML
ncbi:MAG: hypothetical protein K2O60_00765, partial [Ruminococcus sp.]|nr:hypothetical protein [Ruminococcus sp.]